jgi:hypothetical protein
MMPIDTSRIVGVANVGLFDLVIRLLNWVVGFSAVVCVVMIVAAGFQYIFSQGDDEKVGKATSTLIFAIVGMILVFIAPLVIQYVIDNFLS